ncbi:hypothetical protein ABVT39_026153 [Epinephelus coioides]
MFHLFLPLCYYIQPMAPFTSPPSCVSCTRLADRITELEQRISSLHQIREAELQMDTIIFGLAQSESSSATCPVADAASPPAFDVTTPGPAAAVSSPNTNLDNTWIQQGAKPKFLPSSTPSSLSNTLSTFPPPLSDDPNELVNYNNNTLSSCLDQLALIKTKSVSFTHSAPWYTPELRQMKSHKRQLERLHKKTGLTVHRQAYTDHLRQYKAALNTARSTYYSNLIHTGSTNQNALFSTVKSKKNIAGTNRKPWYTSGLHKSSVTKNKLYKRFLTNPTPLNSTVPGQHLKQFLDEVGPFPGNTFSGVKLNRKQVDDDDFHKVKDKLINGFCDNLLHNHYTEDADGATLKDEENAELQGQNQKPKFKGNHRPCFPDYGSDRFSPNQQKNLPTWDRKECDRHKVQDRTVTQEVALTHSPEAESEEIYLDPCEPEPALLSNRVTTVQSNSPEQNLSQFTPPSAVLVVQLNSKDDSSKENPLTIQAKPPFQQFLCHLTEKGVARKFYLSVTLKDELVHEALLDTAADITLMSMTLFNTMRATARPSNKELKLQTCFFEVQPYGPHSTTLKVMALVQLTIGPMTLFHPVYVSSLDAMPLLVGKNHLKWFEPLIDF